MRLEKIERRGSEGEGKYGGKRMLSEMSASLNG